MRTLDTFSVYDLIKVLLLGNCEFLVVRNEQKTKTKSEKFERKKFWKLYSGSGFRHISMMSHKIWFRFTIPPSPSMCGDIIDMNHSSKLRPYRPTRDRIQK